MMNQSGWGRRFCSLLALGSMVCVMVSGCGSGAGAKQAEVGDSAKEAQQTLGKSNIDTTTFLKFVDDNPDIVDPQCTSDFYTIPMNCFDRLVEVKANDDGTSQIVPSLAKSYEVSKDGLTYTFHLNQGVKFSNGADLTSSDVLYTFNRLLTYPKSVNGSIASGLKGAKEVSEGKQKSLEGTGIKIIDDHTFEMILEQPYAAFLAQLTAPGASILDEKTTEEAGDQFGIDPEKTIGTGPFVFSSWTFNSALILSANKNCWSGAPACDGLDIKVVPDDETQRMMYENGEIDFLDLDNAQSQIDYFLKSDQYKNQIVEGTRVGIYYISLNEDIKPLDNPKVRKALQMALDRKSILDAVYGGRGQVENGILPHGLIGYNPNLPEIKYDVEGAKQLLKDVGYANGFDLELDLSSKDDQSGKDLLEIASAMWEQIGVKCTVKTVDDATIQDQKHDGKLGCYQSSWSADFNDPDNFMFTFFGNDANTKFRSLNYKNEDAMQRVTAARAITDETKRIQEYQDLEKLIAQEDAAWIPLFSKQHLYVVSPKVSGFKVSWNGWSNNYYHNVSVKR